MGGSCLKLAKGLKDYEIVRLYDNIIVAVEFVCVSVLQGLK